MRRSILACTLACWSSLGTAEVITLQDLTFSTSGQSMWQPGTAATLNVQEFYGLTWNESSTVGGITGSASRQLTPAYTTTVNTNPLWIAWAGCRAVTPAICGGEPDRWPVTTTIPATYTLDTRTGLQGTASTSGRVGFEMGLSADSGSIASEFDYEVSVEIPDQITQGQFVSLNGSQALADGTLNSNFPTVEAYVSLVMEASAAFTGTGCLVPLGCESINFSTGNLGGTQELISLNQNGEGTVEYFDGDPVLNALLTASLGSPPPSGLPASFASSIVETTIYLPQPDATGGVTGDQLAASGQDDLLDYFLDVDNIVSLGLTGTPNLFGGEVDLGVASLTWDLIDVDMGPTLDLVQNFELSPSLFVDLAFSAPVDVMGRGLVTGLTEMAWNALPDMAFLTDTLVTPTFYLGYLSGGTLIRDTAEFLNQLLLDVDGELYVDILDASLDFGIFGSLDFGIGNIFGSSVDLFSTPPLFASQFGIGGFNAESRSFMVSLYDGAATSVPEPGTLTLLGAGLISMGLLRRRSGSRRRSAR